MKFNLMKLLTEGVRFYEGEAGGGGTSEDDEAAKKAAEEAAAKEAAEKEAAEKETEEAAAKKAAEEEEAKKKAKKTSDAEAKLLKEVMEKKEALKKANEALEKANSRLSEFDGIDPEKVKKLLQDAKDAEDAQLLAAGNFEKLKERMAQEHAKEKGDLEGKIEGLNTEVSSLQQTINDLSIGNSFNSSSFIRDELVLTSAKARIVYGSHFDFEKGNVVGYDKPRGSEDRTPLVDASGTPLSFDEALKQIIDSDPDKERLIKSKMKSGSSSSTKQGAGKLPQTEVQKSSRDKIRAGLKDISQGA